MIKDTQSGYGFISIILHWLSAIAVIGLFIVGYWMVDLSYYSEWYRTAPHYHKSVGLLLLMATLFRIGWKYLNPSPKSLSQNKVETDAAKYAHLLLYVGLLVLMLSGYLISTADGRAIDVFNWFAVPSLGELFSDQEDIAGAIHEYVAYGLMAIAALHAIAALKHHFIDRDNTLKRMLKPVKH